MAQKQPRIAHVLQPRFRAKNIARIAAGNAHAHGPLVHRAATTCSEAAIRHIPPQVRKSRLAEAHIILPKHCRHPYATVSLKDAICIPKTCQTPSRQIVSQIANSLAPAEHVKLCIRISSASESALHQNQKRPRNRPQVSLAPVQRLHHHPLIASLNHQKYIPYPFNNPRALLLCPYVLLEHPASRNISPATQPLRLPCSYHRHTSQL